MNLFDKIPENFFSILVSKNKNIYLGALMVLKNAFDQEMAISKENMVSRLINELENEFFEEDFSEDDTEHEIKENNISSKAYFLLRKLKWAGWIEFEMQRNSFEEYIILPDYSIKFIDLIYSITVEKATEFNTLVYSTYSSLKIAITERKDIYTAIILANNNTEQLVKELKSIYNSLGRFHRKMCNKDNINDIIKEHFLDYKDYSDDIIFPRFTKDSVTRYKMPIRELLNEILRDDQLLEIAINNSYSKKNQNKEKDKSDILKKIRYIIEVYENIDFMMNQIENKANYIDYIQKHQDKNEFVIYHGGMYSPIKKMFFEKIFKSNKNVKFYHWSDIDIGGFRIYHRLNEIIPTLEPYKMDIDSYYEKREYWKYMDENYINILEKMKDDKRYKIFNELILEMLKNKTKLEQEAFIY